MISLGFDTPVLAEILLTAMRFIWGRAQGKMMGSPQALIGEAAETKE